MVFSESELIFELSRKDIRRLYTILAKTFDNTDNRDTGL